MKLNFDKLRILFSIALMAILTGIQAQTTVAGFVYDQSGEPLIGASILVEGTSDGSVSDIDGSFDLRTSAASPFNIVVSYTGYDSKTISITGSTADLKIELDETPTTLTDVVISASRKREKVQEAPASISVISARKLATSAQATDAVRNLVNVPGVQIQQQSASRLNIEMRGGASLFSTGVFPIMDYRSLVGPGIGTFQSDASGISTIDLERIEVVRGAGSALYGPGVSSGVVHFITKNPIDNPGTSFELVGGELNTLGLSVRHATKVSDKFGFKINAQYKRGDEFTLDGDEDADQIARFSSTVSQPSLTETGVVDVTAPGETLLSFTPREDGNVMQDYWWNAAVNATLEFRPQDDLSIFASGGYNQASAVFYNSQGEGLTQNAEYWSQLRVQKGGLFVQGFYVDNDGGTKDRPTFLYQTGLRTPVARKQLEGQIQYNFEVPALLNADFTVGIDYRKATSDTEGLVYGRNEADDDYEIFGGYLQGKFKVFDKLDLVLAGRYDQFNFLDDGAFSPRVALVYKPHPKHTFRASYNNASIPPSALEINIDFPVRRIVPNLFDIWLVGQKESHTFSNPTIDFTAPGIPNLPFGTPGLPLGVAYGAVNEAVLAQLIPGIEDQFGAAAAGAIDAFLRDPANIPSGTTGVFAPYNIFNGEPLTELTPTSSARIAELDSYEIGYKGLLGDKFGLSVDVYTIERTGFFRFTGIAPTIAWVNGDVENDLGAAVAAGIQPYLENTLGLDPATAAAAAGIIGGAYGAGGAGFQGAVAPLASIFGTVESDLVPQDDGIAHVAAGYRTFEDLKLDYWGMDIGIEYYFTNDFSGFANYSYVSQNEWGPDVKDDDDNLPFVNTLNAPQNKYRVGVNYTPEKGLRGSLAFQHDDSFRAEFGQFTGMTDEKNLIDASLGYRFNNGMALDLTANNLFNNEYRAFANFPKIGRIILAKLSYTFGAEE